MGIKPSKKDSAPKYTSMDQVPQADKERFMLAKILAFDVNVGKNPILTIAKRFARENTNDVGDNLVIGTADIVLLELKKFFFLCWCEIQKDKSKY